MKKESKTALTNKVKMSYFFIFLVTLNLAILIHSMFNKELISEYYGVISREKRSIHDYITITLFVAFVGFAFYYNNSVISQIKNIHA